jgi:hypothetical protein
MSYVHTHFRVQLGTLRLGRSWYFGCAIVVVSWMKRGEKETAERDCLPPLELHQPCLAFFLLFCFYESLGKCVARQWRRRRETDWTLKLHNLTDIRKEVASAVLAFIIRLPDCGTCTEDVRFLRRFRDNMSDVCFLWHRVLPMFQTLLLSPSSRRS